MTPVEARGARRLLRRTTRSPIAPSPTCARRRRSRPRSPSICSSAIRPRTRRCRCAPAIATPIAAPTTPAGTSSAAQRLERQRELGIVPATTQLPPLSPGADAVGHARCDAEARLRPLHGGLRRPDHQPRRQHRPLARRARRRRLAREHAGRGLLRQRRLGGGHADRHAQRLRARLRPAGAARGGRQALRRDGRRPDLPALSDRLGVRLEHAVSASTSSTRTSAASPIR